MHFGKYKLKRCRYGWMLYAGPYIGKSFDVYGEYSESELGLLRQFIRSGDTVIDVGANIGDLTVPLSQMVGSAGRVYAIEANPENFNVLCANLALNNIANVWPRHCFLRASETEAASPAVVGTDPSAAVYRSLDSLEVPACRLIKIDVDGGEHEVLSGSVQTIAKFRPIIYAENDVRPKSPALIGFLLGLNYRLYWHLAPLYNPDNFFGHRENVWSPTNVISIMVLALPAESGHMVSGLRPITSPDDWWQSAGAGPTG